jgi:hypothetical protein
MPHPSAGVGRELHSRTATGPKLLFAAEGAVLSVQGLDFAQVFYA